MQDVALIWSNASTEVHRLVVGELDNNVYIVRCRRSGRAALIDAANEHERLLEVSRALGVELVLETHGHWDHIGAVEAVRDAGIAVWVAPEDADMLPSYDELLIDDHVFALGDVRLRSLHTPGHTPGSMSFIVENTPLLFSGDTLFPGGPGATHFPGGDFALIMNSIEQRMMSALDPATIVWPGHGQPTTLANEAPHLDAWWERGW